MCHICTNTYARVHTCWACERANRSPVVPVQMVATCKCGIIAHNLRGEKTVRNLCRKHIKSCRLRAFLNSLPRQFFDNIENRGKKTMSACIEIQSTTRQTRLRKAKCVIRFRATPISAQNSRATSSCTQLRSNCENKRE